MPVLDKKTPSAGEWKWLLLAVAMGLLLRFVVIAVFSQTPWSDELAYKSMALELAQGRRAMDSMGNHAMYSVGYSMFVLAPIFYWFGENLFAARMANMLLGGVALVLCYQLAREAGAGRIGRLLAVAAWATYLPALTYGSSLAKENLMVPLMLGILWCALRLARRFSLATAIGCGVLLGLLAISGSSGLALFGAVVLALFFTPVAVWRRLALLAVVMVTATAVCLPWLMRNQEVIGAPVLNTNGGFNLYLGNNPAATGWYISIADTPFRTEWHALRKIGEVHANETLKQEAIAWIKGHPAEFAKLSLKKIVYFWTPPVHKGEGVPSFAESAARAIWLLEFLVLTLLAIASLFFKPLHTRPVLILWSAVVFYTAAHMIFYVNFRYRLPIIPVIGLFAALAVEAFWQSRSKPLALKRQKL